MYTLKGKYNSANIMLPEGEFADDETTKQIYSFLNHPAFQNTYIAIMPDCHAGKGSCIGYTQKLNDYIIPNLIGVDIGCGVWTVKLFEFDDSKLPKLDEWIKNNIAHGFNVNDKEQYKYLYSSYDAEFLNVLLQLVSHKVGSDYTRNLLSLGSLGGGNHFIEIGKDSKDDFWLTVHTGSRKFGLDVANYHQDRAKKHLENNFIAGIPKDLEFLYKDDEYFNDMKMAQKFAIFNRQIILNRILEYLNTESVTGIQSIHNYIDFKDKIIRKGAISANKDQEVVIPFNMQDGLIIGKGKGNPKWNYSAPHGAGRIMSRAKAKQTLDLDFAEFEMEQLGIYSTTIPLDEVKDAYKPKEIILSVIEETVDITDFIKPIYNFKG